MTVTEIPSPAEARDDLEVEFPTTEAGLGYLARTLREVVDELTPVIEDGMPETMGRLVYCATVASDSLNMVRQLARD